MTKRSRNDEFDERHSLKERSSDLEEAELERKHWLPWKEAHAEALQTAPARWVDQLRQFIISRRPAETDDSDVKSFLSSIESYGLMPTLVYQINRDDVEKNRDEYLYPNLLREFGLFQAPYEILRDTLAVEQNADVRGLAVKWLRRYAEPEFNPVPLLVPLLSDRAPTARYWAALHLSELAPESPGLVPVLIEALQADYWAAYIRRSWHFGCSCRGETALALARLGTAARPALPALSGFPFKDDESFDQVAIQLARGLISGEVEPAIETLANSFSLFKSVPADFGYLAAPNVWLILSEQVYPMVLDGLRHPAHAVRRAAAEMSWQICDDNGDPPWRGSATGMSHVVETSAIVNALQATRVEDNPLVAQAVAYALRKFDASL